MKAPFDLVYYVWSELLVGTVHGESFCVRAVSGGGRGRTQGVPETSFASFSPHRGTNSGARIRGGVIPPGLWKIERPSLYSGAFAKPVAKLIPAGNQASLYPTREYENEPFLIHGRGERGSNGCIVIERVERVRLLDSVEKSGGAVLLVTNEIRPGDLLDRVRRAALTA